MPDPISKNRHTPEPAPSFRGPPRAEKSNFFFLGLVFKARPSNRYGDSERVSQNLRNDQHESAQIFLKLAGIRYEEPSPQNRAEPGGCKHDKPTLKMLLISHYRVQRVRRLAIHGK